MTSVAAEVNKRPAEDPADATIHKKSSFGIPDNIKNYFYPGLFDGYKDQLKTEINVSKP